MLRDIFMTGGTTSLLSGSWCTQFGIIGMSGNLFADSIQIAESGNIYATGRYASSVFLVKFDPFGSVIWCKKLYDLNNVKVPITLDPDENIYLTTRSGQRIIKINSDGLDQWAYNDTGPYTYGSMDAIVYYNGYVYTSGYVDRASNFSNESLCIYQYDAASGGRIRTLIHDETSVTTDGTFNNLAIAASGIYVAGDLKSYAGVICSANFNGDLVWRKGTQDFVYSSTGHSLAISPDGTQIFTGYRYSSDSKGGVISFTSGGTKKWERKWTNLYDCINLVATNTQSVFIASTTSTYTNLAQYYILKIDSEGNQLLCRKFSLSSMRYTPAIATDADENLYMFANYGSEGFIISKITPEDLAAPQLIFGPLTLTEEELETVSNSIAYTTPALINYNLSIQHTEITFIPTSLNTTETKFPIETIS